MPAPDPSPPTFMPGRKWRIGLHVVTSVLALLAIVVMVNYLSSRHYRRFHVGPGSRVALSPVTLQILKAVTNELKVIVFFDSREPLYGSVVQLLNEYQAKCPKLTVEHVDYLRYRGRAEMVQSQYKMAPGEGDRVIFDSNGKVKVVYEKELSDYDYSSMLKGREVRRTAFKGEQLFTAAIYSVIDPNPVKAYFVQGHTEHDPMSKEDRGYFQFARLLEESNIQWERLYTLREEEVPRDCQLLIVAGPIQAYAPEELDHIENYLNQGGRLLALLNFQSIRDKRDAGIERLLAAWGVEVGRNYVTDQDQSKEGDPQLVVVSTFGSHPIVKPLLSSRLLLIVPRALTTSAGSSPSADGPKVTELAFTGPAGAVRQRPGRPSRTGSIPLVAAVERGGIQGISANHSAARIVVVGESSFLDNQTIEYEANRDFARNAVNWLLNREIMVEGIGPRAIREYRVTLTESQMRAARWLLLAVFPGAVLLMGTVVWARRRS